MVIRRIWVLVGARPCGRLLRTRNSGRSQGRAPTVTEIHFLFEDRGAGLAAGCVEFEFGAVFGPGDHALKLQPQLGEQVDGTLVIRRNNRHDPL